MIVIDAKNQVAGRLAARAAKILLANEEVAVINSELAVISGPVHDTVGRMVSRRSQQNKRDPEEGPKYPRIPHLFLRRIIGGMMPKKTRRGRDAMHRLRCYIGVPKDIDAKSALPVFEGAAKPAGSLRKSSTVGKVCGLMGWKA